MAALFARLWLSRSVTDPVGLTVAKPFRTPMLWTPALLHGAPQSGGYLCLRANPMVGRPFASILGW